MGVDQNLVGNCILCAEDNELNQIILDHSLVEQDLPYVIVDNGKEAVEAWGKLNPRLVLMDISMPVMDGIEAIRQIRDLEETTRAGKRTCIAVLTAHVLEGVREKVMETGADHFITKPISPRELCDQVVSILTETEDLRLAV